MRVRFHVTRYAAMNASRIDTRAAGSDAATTTHPRRAQQSQHTPAGYVDTIGAARRMCRSPATLKKWRKQNIGPAYTRTTESTHGRVLYAIEDIDAFLQRLRHEPPPHRGT